MSVGTKPRLINEPAIEMFDLKCSLTQHFIRDLIRDSCGKFNSNGEVQSRRIELDLIQAGSKIEHFYLLDAAGLELEANRTFESRHDLELSNPVLDQLMSMSNDDSMNLSRQYGESARRSTLLLRAMVAMVLQIQSGYTLGYSLGANLILSKSFLADCYSLSRRLIWLDNWCEKDLPLTVSELHQISKPIASFQKAAFHRIVRHLKGQNIDDDQIGETILLISPPHWVKDSILRFAKTPVLIQGFDTPSEV